MNKAVKVLPSMDELVRAATERIATVAIVAAVADPDPQMAENPAAAMIVVIANPPGNCPIQLYADL